MSRPDRPLPAAASMPKPAAAVAALCLVLAAPAGAQPAAGVIEETIGTWRLTCATDRMTDRAACTLLHQQPAERSEPGRPSLALEILDRGGRLVPAVTARDLTLEGAARGLLALAGAAQLRVPPNPMVEMPCGLEGRSLICAPRAEDTARAEQELAGAGLVLLRMVGPGGGGSSTAEPAELRLARTREAMERFRRLVPPGAQPAEPAGLDAREMLNRLRQLFGG